jgi:hypothetical protein
MKQVLFLLIALFVFRTASAADGDTLKVQTFTFGSKQDSTFKFPDQSKKYRKVLMYYTLKCNPKQNPACGEWDYLTYTYLYQKTNRFDSAVKSIDTTFDGNHNVVRIDTTWNVTPHLDRYELARYITPYGKGLDLGKNGFTWVYDVTDYLPLLHDSVHLSAGNWQELLNLTFAFVEGSPDREPYKVVNIWTGNFNYGNTKDITDIMGQKNITIDPNAGEVRLKVRVTGHGFGGTDDCSEFCPRNHSVNINGTERWKQYVWRDNCGQNPVAAQGGTWVYNRSNWCPGAEVGTYDAEITPYVTPGQSASFDYHVDPYTWNGQGTTPYYNVEAQLIYYTKNNTNQDAALEDIIAPSTASIYSRKNPICSQPEVIVSNQGTSPITSINFSYGVTGSNMNTFTWTGNIDYQQKADIFLPAPYYAGSGFPNFQVQITGVNGGADQNSGNNIIRSQVPLTTVLPNTFIINLLTNKAPEQNSYTLKDAEGNVLYSRSGMEASKLYRDTVHLGNTCYTFELTDDGDNGLSWWAAPDEGSGYIRFTNLGGKIIKTFNPDFGSGITFNFNTSYGLSVQNALPDEHLQVYPNPASCEMSVDFSAIHFRRGAISIYSADGRLVREQEVSFLNAAYKTDVSGMGKGVYFIRLQTEDHVFTEKFIVGE